MASRIIKIKYRIRLLISSLMILLIISSLAGCKKLELNSQWRQGNITIDGINREWKEATTFLENENILVGVMNDDEYLYLSLITNDRFMWNRMTGMGFTIWFDPAGGKKKVFGIQYPLGMQEMGVPMMGWRGSDENREKRHEIIEQSLNELKILGADKDDWDRMLVKDATGIEVKVNNDSSSFVYELKVPLMKSEQHPYAIGVEPGAPVGIGLEMQKIDREKMWAGRGGGMHGRGMGPPGGMRGGMGGPPAGGMRGGMERPRMPEPLKLWMKVKLKSD
jgi:hypothetical protein